MATSSWAESRWPSHLVKPKFKGKREGPLQHLIPNITPIHYTVPVYYIYLSSSYITPKSPTRVLISPNPEPLTLNKLQTQTFNKPYKEGPPTYKQSFQDLISGDKNAILRYKSLNYG